MKYSRWFTASVVGAGLAVCAFAGCQGVLADGQAGGTSAVSAIPPQYAAQAAQGARDQQAIDLATPYVTRNADGTLSLTLPPSVQAAIGGSELSRLQGDLQRTDTWIHAGELATTPSGHVYAPASQAISIQGGRNAVVYQWWGVQIYLNQQYSEAVGVVLMAGGSIVALLCAAGPEVCVWAGTLAIALIGYGAWIEVQALVDSNGDIINIEDFAFTWYLWISGQ
jgi:hypothetical protein